MRKTLGNIIRLKIAYSKFFIMLTFLSLSYTYAQADNSTTYLKCTGKNGKNRYYGLTGSRLYGNYNIRTKKFGWSTKVTSYGETWIKAGYTKINRDTGVLTYNNSIHYNCNKVNFQELPQLNSEGKKF